MENGHLSRSKRILLRSERWSRRENVPTSYTDGPGGTSPPPQIIGKKKLIFLLKRQQKRAHERGCRWVVYYVRVWFRPTRIAEGNSSNHFSNARLGRTRSCNIVRMDYIKPLPDRRKSCRPVGMQRDRSRPQCWRVWQMPARGHHPPGVYDPSAGETIRCAREGGRARRAHVRARVKNVNRTGNGTERRCTSAASSRHISHRFSRRVTLRRIQRRTTVAVDRAKPRYRRHGGAGSRRRSISDRHQPLQWVWRRRRKTAYV